MNKMQSVVIQAVPATSHRVVRYNSKVSFMLGGTQIAFGVICVMLNMVGIVITMHGYFYHTTWHFDVGHGIWAGAFVSRKNLYLLSISEKFLVDSSICLLNQGTSGHRDLKNVPIFKKVTIRTDATSQCALCHV